MSAAAAGPSPAREGGAGRDEWLRIYNRMAAILRENHRRIEALLADRAGLEAIVKIHHNFWVTREGLLRDRLDETLRAEACVKSCDDAKLDLLVGVKDREARRYQIYAKTQDEDMEELKTYTEALAAENDKLKMKLKEAESSAEPSESTREHGHSGRNWRAEIRELKTAYKNLSSEKDKEVSALVAQKDFVWHQLQTMEKDYDSLLKKKKLEAAQATEAAQRLQQKVEELQAAAKKKDDDIGRLQAEANGANKKILLLESKLQKLHFQASEDDDETQKVKGGHRQACQKRKQDINGTHRKSRSEGGSLRGKSKNNPRRQMVEEDQPETSQKRQCASSLSNALALRRCSLRMHLMKPAMGSPAPQQVLFHSSFKVPKLKTPATPPPPPL